VKEEQKAHGGRFAHSEEERWEPPIDDLRLSPASSSSWWEQWPEAIKQPPNCAAPCFFCGAELYRSQFSMTAFHQARKATRTFRAPRELRFRTC